jgi:hypothetical protein
VVNEDVFLTRSAERVAGIDELASRLAPGMGARVGVEGVLADLNRSARPTTRVSGLAGWGFRWDAADERTRRWWPQGITSSADRSVEEHVHGRSVIVTSAYSHDIGGVNKGARLTFVDITDRWRVRYRHVLLVDPRMSDTGMVDVHRVRVHAGGIVWHGPWIHVAATARGLCSFHVEDILRVPASSNRSRLGFRTDGGFDGFGHRYVLPLRFTYDGQAAPGHERLRYSFLSLDRSEQPAHLVVGEYGRGDMTTRLTRFEIDPATTLLRPGADGVVRPDALHHDGVPQMQGATVVGGNWYLTTSAGRERGSLWAGRPGAFVQAEGAVPVGPEDLMFWPSTDQLWSLTEYPGLRQVLAIDRAHLA